MFRYLAKGWVDTATWLIVTKVDAVSSAKYVVQRDSLNNTFDLDSLTALTHETVHFWHAISTTFLYLYSLSNFRNCNDAMRKLRKGQMSAEELSHARSSFEEAAQVLTEEIIGLRTLDIIEGSAVLCAYRAFSFTGDNHDAFIRYLKQAHHNRTEYTIAYEFATQLLGEPAYDLFAPAAFLALQSPKPLELFIALIGAAAKFGDPKRGRENPLNYLSEMSGVPLDICFVLNPQNRIAEMNDLLRREGVLPPDGDMEHYILKPYVESAHKIPGGLDFFARPYHYMRPGGTPPPAGLLDTLMPPVYLVPSHSRTDTVYSMGLGAKLGMDYIAKVCGYTALIGVVRKTIMGTVDEMICWHKACPVYKTGLCHRYYLIPSEDYKECRFSDFLRVSGLDRLLSEKGLFLP